MHKWSFESYASRLLSELKYKDNFLAKLFFKSYHNLILKPGHITYVSKSKVQRNYDNFWSRWTRTTSFTIFTQGRELHCNDHSSSGCIYQLIRI